MTDSPGLPYPYNLFWGLPGGKLPGFAAPAAAASASLVQPILPGWSFGNVTVNETNSNAPDTEQRIVAQKSYGLQIGVLLDALAALVADPERKAAETIKALAAVTDLEQRVNAIKAKAAEARIDRIEADLDTLRDKSDKTDYQAAAARLQAYLTQHPAATRN